MLNRPCFAALLTLTGALGGAGFVAPAMASCGATFCSVNAQWETQGVWTGEGLRFGLRFEYIDQDQLRSGRDQTVPAGIPGTEDELRTVNRNWIASLDYGISRDWSLSLQLPYLLRDHRHTVNDVTPTLEAWELRNLGDLQLVARRQLLLDEDATFGVQFGAKLPTGSYKETNADGILAERSLQPGSGTTDALLGVYYHRKLEGDATTLFAQALWRAPLSERDGYAPGQQAQVDVGLRYDLTLKTSALLQLNMHWKDRDQGIYAEPDDTGRTEAQLSPGVSHLLTPQLQLYGFVQVPLYRYVNGTQLTADWSAIAGVSWKP